MKIIHAVLAVLFTFTSLAFGQSLEDTNNWMQVDLDHYAQDGQHILLKGETIPEIKGGLFHGIVDEECRMFVTGEDITVHPNTPDEQTYPMMFQFALSTLDPNSVQVKTHKGYISIDVETTNDAGVVWWTWNGELYGMTKYDFKFNKFQGASEHAARFAKALQHAITLCGGKASTF